MIDDLRFHVVYVGGTVRRLLPCLDTLLAYSEWRFVLIANGCSPDEVAMLRERASSFAERVDVVITSHGTVQDHGAVLDSLLAEERGPHFAFIDSDILAVGPIDSGALLPREGEAASCSCLPFWHDPDDHRIPNDFKVLSGRFLETPDARTIGCTYAAVYRTEQIRHVLEQWDISLCSYEWRELPPALRERFASHGLRYRFYDTTKVANLILSLDGSTITYRDVGGLLHLGGQSGFFGSGWGAKERVRGRIWAAWPGLNGLVWRLRGLGRDECRSTVNLIRRRRRVMKMLDGVYAGTIGPDERPDWIEEETFKGIYAMSVDQPRQR